MRSVVDRAQRRRVVVVSLVLMVCAQSEPSLPGAKMAEMATARAKTRATTTVSDGEGGGAGGDKRKMGRSEVWHAVLLRRTRTRRRRHASYPPARRLLGVRSLLARASRFRLPPVYLSFSFYKRLSWKITCDITFFTTSSFSSLIHSTHHQRASHDLRHCIRRYAPSSEARKVPIGMFATSLHSACTTLRKMTII